jgi:hypothetical protein
VADQRAGLTRPPPVDFRVHRPVAAFLGVEERWLFRAEGEAPEPALWAAWCANASLRATGEDAPADDRPTYLRVAEQYGGEVVTGSRELRADVRKKPTKRAASGGKKPKR